MKHKTITVKSICKKLLIKIEGFSATIIKHFPERVENQLEIIKSFNLKCNASVKCFMRTLWIMRLVLVIWHNIIATESKNFNMRGVGVFFHWRRGGILMGTVHNRLWGGIQLEKLNCIHVLSFSQFCKII